MPFALPGRLPPPESVPSAPQSMEHRSAASPRLAAGPYRGWVPVSSPVLRIQPDASRGMPFKLTTTRRASKVRNPLLTKFLQLPNVRVADQRGLEWRDGFPLRDPNR